MQRFGNILVGIDLDWDAPDGEPALTEASRYAAEQGMWLAEQIAARLMFFSVVDVPLAEQEALAEGDERIATTIRLKANTLLKEWAQRSSRQGIEATAKLVLGTPWIEIIRQVLRDEHDLVIVGTRGAQAGSRLLFGGTAMKLLRKCPSAVWVVKPEAPPEVMNILVASDLTEVGLEALHNAVNMSQLIDAKIHLLHVTEASPTDRLMRAKMTVEQRREAEEQQHNQAHQALHEQLAETDYRTLAYGVKVHVEGGSADAAILKAIQEHEIDLLVMGMAGRSGIRGMLIGNTAERVLPEVPCSTLAIKPEGFVSPILLE